MSFSLFKLNVAPNLNACSSSFRHILKQIELTISCKKIADTQHPEVVHPEGRLRGTRGRVIRQKGGSEAPVQETPSRTRPGNLLLTAVQTRIKCSQNH